MYSSFALMAVAGALLNNVSLSTAWVNDYRVGRELGQQQQKPLVVFVGQGGFDWKQITQEGQPDGQVQKLLAERYVRVYMDSRTEYGRKVADAIGVSGGRGLVISDRQGGMMAFRHTGELSAQDLARRLERYADPNLAVQTTETVNPPAPAAGSVPYYYPSFGGACRT